MPVEIRELIIKVNVNPEQATPPGSGSSTTGTNDEKEALVSDTVEEVLRIIENKKER